MSDPKRGPGRPPSPDGPAPRVTVRIPARLLNRLEAEARARGLSRSRALVSAIRAYLGDADPMLEGQKESP